MYKEIAKVIPNNSISFDSSPMHQRGLISSAADFKVIIESEKFWVRVPLGASENRRVALATFEGESGEDESMKIILAIPTPL